MQSEQSEYWFTSDIGVVSRWMILPIGKITNIVGFVKQSNLNYNLNFSTMGCFLYVNWEATWKIFTFSLLKKVL